MELKTFHRRPLHHSQFIPVPSPLVSMAIHNDVEDWAGAGSINSGERAWLLQSPSVDTDRHLEAETRRPAGVSPLGAVVIVVNAALGAGLLNFPAAFSMAGGITAGVTLQMVRRDLRRPPPTQYCCIIRNNIPSFLILPFSSCSSSLSVAWWSSATALRFVPLLADSGPFLILQPFPVLQPSSTKHV